MSLSERSRKQGLKAAQKLLPGAHVRAYVVGRSGQNPAKVMALILGVAAAGSIALWLATGAVVIPGILAIILLQHAISPPKGIVVADQGLAVVKRSLLNGKPSEIVALVGHGFAQPLRSEMGQVEIQFGPELVWLHHKEEARLRAALLGAPTAQPAYV